jgi:hypothetical protein
MKIYAVSKNCNHHLSVPSHASFAGRIDETVAATKRSTSSRGDCGSQVLHFERHRMTETTEAATDPHSVNSFRTGSLRPAVEKFFNDEIDAGHVFLRSYLQARPDDALAHAIDAALHLYGTLVAWLLGDGKVSAASLVRGHRMDLSDDRRDKVMAALRDAERSAERALTDPDCADMGIFALALASCIRRDYHGFVLNQWKESLAQAREANWLGRKLLKVNSGAHDAYCIFGWSEYLIANVPGVARPFATIPGIAGDRAKAVGFCEVASQSGCYFREFAACLLVALYSELNRPGDAIRILSELARQFPNNSTVAAELNKRTAAGAE